MSLAQIMGFLGLEFSVRSERKPTHARVEFPPYKAVKGLSCTEVDSLVNHKYYICVPILGLVLPYGLTQAREIFHQTCYQQVVVMDSPTCHTQCPHVDTLLEVL